MEVVHYDVSGIIFSGDGGGAMRVLAESSEGVVRYGVSGISSLGDDGGAMGALAEILPGRTSRCFQPHYLSFPKRCKENKSSTPMDCSPNI
jgi:hypothetical protein